MQDIKSTIKEYQASGKLLKSRINELSARIMGGYCKYSDTSTVKRLQERRMKLYTELWDIEYAIREMQEYLNSIQEVTEHAS